MSETRREALKFTVLTALGLAACGDDGKDGHRPLTGPKPQPDLQSDILINTGVNWVLLEPVDTSTYHAFQATRPLSGTQPDLGAATSSPIWADYTGGNIPLPNSNVTITVNNSVVQKNQLMDLLHQNLISQNSWNEIGAK